MLNSRPKSRFEDEDGFINLALIGTIPEYPEVTEWDRLYAAECDQLATIRALRHSRHFGRWYLSGNYLSTDICRASEGDYKGGVHGSYDIPFWRLNCITEREQWLNHMTEKVWLGKKGLDDLKTAFDSMLKAGLIK